MPADEDERPSGKIPATWVVVCVVFTALWAYVNYTAYELLFVYPKHTQKAQSVSPDGKFRCTVVGVDHGGSRDYKVTLESRARLDFPWRTVRTKRVPNDRGGRAVFYSVAWDFPDNETTGVRIYNNLVPRRRSQLRPWVTLGTTASAVPPTTQPEGPPEVLDPLAKVLRDIYRSQE